MNTDPTYRGPIDPQAIFVIRWLAVAGQLTARNAGWAYLLPDVRIRRLRDTRQSVSMPDKKTGARQ